MSGLVEHISPIKPGILSFLHSYNIEEPKSNRYYCDGEMIRIAGWVIPNPNISACLILILNNKEIGRHELNIKRPDVATTFNLQNHNQNLGFDYSFKEGSFSKISLSVDGNSYEILNFKNIECDNEITQATTETLKETHRIFIAPGQIEKISKITDYILILNQFAVFEKTDDALQRISKLFPESGIIAKSVEGLVNSLKDHEWSLKSIKKTLEDEELVVESLFGNQQAICVGSIAILDFNYLIFRDGNQVFYIVQCCGVVSLILPFLTTVIGLSVPHWVEHSLKNLTQVFQAITNFKPALQIERNKIQPIFLGLNVSNSRPYHFFYDYLHCLSFLYDSSFNLPKKNFSVNGLDFIDATSLFQSGGEWQTLDQVTLNNYVLANHGFLLSPCLQYIKTNGTNSLARLANELVRSSNNNKLELIQGNPQCESLINSHLIVWIGISTEKRSWLEQVEGYSSIISNLKLKYKNLCILVDGRTFPLTPSIGDIDQAKRENIIFNDLIKKTPGVSFVNMIGFTMLQKIHFADKCSFFISSYSTDSMYPSAICKKPGVTYAPPSIKNQRSLHIHHNIIEVPDEKIKEITGPDNSKKSWFETSVSIDWQDIYSCVLNLIEKNGIQK